LYLPSDVSVLNRRRRQDLGQSVADGQNYTEGVAAVGDEIPFFMEHTFNDDPKHTYDKEVRRSFLDKNCVLEDGIGSHVVRQQ
jgi:hypothetical protein